MKSRCSRCKTIAMQTASDVTTGGGPVKRLTDYCWQMEREREGGKEGEGERDKEEQQKKGGEDGEKRECKRVEKERWQGRIKQRKEEDKKERSYDKERKEEVKAKVTKERE